MVSASPEWEEMVKTPREFVTAVRIDGLKQAQHDPNVHSEDVQISSHRTPEDWTTDSAKPKNHNLNWGRILGCHAERCRVLMVNLVNGLV